MILPRRRHPAQPAGRLGDTRRLWTLPGGGLGHGEDPGRAVVRRSRGDRARPSVRPPGLLRTPARVWREGRRVDAHALRIRADGWVPVDAGAGPGRSAGQTVGRRGSRSARYRRIGPGRDHGARGARRPTTARPSSSGSRRTRSSPGRRRAAADPDLPGATAADPDALPGGGSSTAGHDPQSAVVQEVREECGSGRDRRAAGPSTIALEGPRPGTSRGLPRRPPFSRPRSRDRDAAGRRDRWHHRRRGGAAH